MMGGEVGEEVERVEFVGDLVGGGMDVGERMEWFGGVVVIMEIDDGMEGVGIVVSLDEGVGGGLRGDGERFVM